MLTETLIATGHDCAPPLTAKLAPWMNRFIEQPSIAGSLLEVSGSTVHIVVASEFGRNANDLLTAFKAYGISGGLFFARKANKLPWFVKLSKENGIGVDTASLKELQETLDLGVSPDQIIVTAVGKTKELVSQAVAKKCLLVIDNLDEIKLVRSQAQSLGQVARIGLRFSGFKVNGHKIFSRFGLSVDDFPASLLEATKDSWLSLELLHAHLDRYDVEERACAARQLIEIADHAAKHGQKVSAIDLGGGILVRYLKNESDWTEFLSSLAASVAGDCPSFTYLADGLGFYKAGNKVVGNADLYPAWNKLSKERFIAAILDHKQDGFALHKDISGRGLKLYFEPGRALLDNAGITLATVLFRKRDTLGNLLIGLAMNRTNLRPFRAEFCVDPILLAPEPRRKISEGAFLVGSLCGEGDVIMRRKLRLKCLPEPGDILLFANTAGYLSHHLEVGTHGNTLPVNLLIDEHSFEIHDQFCN